MKKIICPTCSNENFIALNTYKRVWRCCKQCGTAVSQQKSNYLFSWLPYADLKKGRHLDEEKMYDYFVEDVHIGWSENEGKEFISDYLNPANIEVSGRTLLDISGGNGHFIKQIENLGAQITLTEINKKTIDYAKRQHGFQVFEYNLNEHELSNVVGQRFDIVFARACIMFAKDLKAFVEQLRKTVNLGGYVMINHSVIPTLGVMLRTQLDEFSYFILRQPESIIEEFTKNGFELHHRADETDPSLYVYDNDLLPHWRMVHGLYEWQAVRTLEKNRTFSLPARDRRRSTLVFKLTN